MDFFPQRCSWRKGWWGGGGCELGRNYVKVRFLQRRGVDCLFSLDYEQILESTGQGKHVAQWENGDRLRITLCPSWQSR